MMAVHGRDVNKFEGLSYLHRIFDVKVCQRDSCSMGGDRAMNIIITRVPVLNAPECEVKLPRSEIAAHLKVDLITHFSLLALSHKKQQEKIKDLKQKRGN